MFNNKAKMFLLLGIIFIALIGMSTATATATDNNATDVPIIEGTSTYAGVDSLQTLSTNKNTEIHKQGNDNLKESDSGSFTDLNTKISDSDRITLENDYIKEDDETRISINKTVTIDGNGKTIFSDNGMFTITSTGNVTFKNTNFVGGTGSNSAFSVAGILNMLNCTFSDHQSNSRAFDVNADATVNIEKSEFYDIEDKGAFYLAARTTAQFKDCVFTNCMNTIYGGAISNYRSGTLTIDNCTFNDNTASQRGGAVYTNGGDLIVKNSTFTNNKVLTTEAGNHQGGKALYVEGNLYLYNNTMSGNTGISADIFNSFATIHTPVTITIDNATCQEGESVNLTASIVDDNGNSIDLISEPTAIIGLDDSRNLTHFNFTIEDNKYDILRNQSVNGIVTRTISPNLPAGIYTINVEYWAEEFKDANVITGTLNITETPLYTYAKLQNIMDETTESEFTLDYNVKRGATETTVNITRDIILDLNGNTWDANQEQALVINNLATLTLKNGYIVNVSNTQPNSQNYYGRLARVNSGNLILENVTITNSSSPIFGYNRGSLIRLGTGASLTADNCTIENVQATFVTDNGRGNININNTKFINNNLGSDLFALIENNGTTTINNTVFDSNTANYAMIYGVAQKDRLVIENVSFIRNTVYVGAPLYTAYESIVTNSLFLDNKATRMTGKSGAIYTNGGSLTVTNTTFKGNTATDNDGSIIHHSGYFPGDLTVTNSVLIPANDKAAIYNDAEDEITATVNYNYWGTNSTPSSYVKSGKYEDDYGDDMDCSPVDVKYWVVMNTTATPNDNLQIADTVTIETSYNTYTDGNSYYPLEGSIPDIEVQYTSTSGSIETPKTTHDGLATTTYKLDSETATITATDSYNTNTIELSAFTPEVQIITLNDGNWSYYFDENGFLRESVVPAGSELRFEGEFNNRDMLFQIPLNLTTAENQAIFRQSSIYVSADGVNITKLEMAAEDMDYPLITVEASQTNVNNNMLTLINNGDETYTHAIEVLGGSNNILHANTITTTGPENPIEYASDYSVELIYTTSIYATSQNLTIDQNNILTKTNGYVGDYGTIYGIYIQGRGENNTINNVQVMNNEIVTEGKSYDYGIKMDWINNALIENNTVTINSELFSSAIHPFAITQSTISNNIIKNNAQKIAYGIVLEGAMDLETQNVIVPKQTQVTNNRIDLDSKYAWGIEAYAGEENTINYNNITILADNGIGMGITDVRTTASYNTITVTATMTDDITGTFDYIDPRTAGIKIVESGISTVQSNNISYNNITVSAPNTIVAAVNSTTDNNVITNNYMVSPYGKGDNAVINTGKNIKIENNTPLSPKTSMIKLDDIKMNTTDTETVEITVTDQNENPITEGTLNIYIDDEEIQTVQIGQDPVELVIEGLSEGNHTLKTEYITNNEDLYTSVTSTANIEVTRQNVELKLDSINSTVSYNEEITISGTINEITGHALPNKTITIGINGENISVTSDEEGKYSYNFVTIQTGQNIITANFAGDEIYLPESNEITFNVKSIDVNLVVDDISDMIYDETVTITGKVTDINDNIIPDHTVNVTLNTNTVTVTTDANGTFILTTKANVIGENNVTITSIPTDKYNPKTINTRFNVLKKEINISIDPVSDVVYGENIVVTGKLVDSDDNALYNTAVWVTVNGRTVSVKTDDNGEYRVTSRASVIGEATVVASFAGNDIYGEDTAEATYNVTKKEIIISIDPVSDVVYGENIVVTGKLVDSGDNALYNTAVWVTINGKTVSAKTDVSGVYRVTSRASVIGKATVVASFTGNSIYGDDTAEATYNVNKQSIEITLDEIDDAEFTDNITITGKLTNANGGVLYNTALNVTINSKTVRVKTDANGTFKVTTKANVMGENKVMASYASNNYYIGSNTTSQFTVNKKDVIVTADAAVYSNGNFTISGTFKDADGNSMKNSKVMITLNGKNTYVKTDTTGVYTLAGTSKMDKIVYTVGYAGNDKYNPYTSSEAVLTKT